MVEKYAFKIRATIPDINELSGPEDNSNVTVQNFSGSFY